MPVNVSFKELPIAYISLLIHNKAVKLIFVYDILFKIIPESENK